MRPTMLAAIALAVGCAKQPEPNPRTTQLDLELEDVVIDEIDLEEARGRLQFDFVNPYHQDAVIRTIDWTFELAGTSPLRSRTYRHQVTLPADQEGTFSLDLVVPWASVEPALDRYPDRDELAWRLTGTAVVDTPGGQREISFSDTGQTPVLHPPELALEQIRMRAYDPQTKTATVDLVFDVGSRQLTSLRDLTYEVSFGGAPVAEGARAARTFDLRQDTWVLPAQLDLSNVHPQTLRSLLNEGSVPVDVRLRGEVQTVHGAVPLDHEFTGTAAVVGRPVG